MEQPQTYIYEFDDFRVDPGRRLLLRGGGRLLPLTPKAFDTLVYVVQHTDVILGKETLMRAIWSETVVEENNLNQCISALRRALGEKRAEHRYIVTVPGRGYRFVAPVNKRKPILIASSAEPITSIAVLPFQPLARDNRDGSLEMGMADTLIARLSGIRDIVVRPMSSVRKYAGFELDVLAAGRELGVESVLEGSLQRQAHRVRVTVRLLNVPDGASLWAGTFDEELTDIFALQDAISERVVQALSLELSKEEKTRLVKHDTQSTRAYQLYLKGRYYWWKNSPEEYKKSGDYFHRAVEEDPSYALGYCGLNSFYGYGAAWGIMSPDDGWPKAEWAVTKALELDDQLAEAHLDLAALKMVYSLDWVGAERESKRAIELSPGFDEIHYAYSFFLVVMRRFREAVAEGKRALQCNPFSLRISQHLGYAMYCERRYDEAIQQYRKAIELDPNDASVREALGDTYERNGQYQDAVEQWTKAMLLANDAELVAILSSSKAKEAVDRAVQVVAAKRLDRLLRSGERGDYVPAIKFAREHLRADHKEEALKWLTLACEERNVPAHYDGMRMQNLMVNTLWLFTPQSQGGLGMTFDPSMLGQMTPTQFAGFLGQQVQQNYSQYQLFSNNLTFPALKQAIGQFSPQMQQMLMNYLGHVPGVLQNSYSANNDALMTNRLRLRFDAKVADNVSFGARLSMYKVFGDSTGVQVFDGQPTSLAIDGTTTRVPNGDMIRVDRAYFSWNDIAGSKLYLSIGRRPSTEGPPLNFRNDEPRGGTPSGSLIDFQFDGITAGYKVNEKMTLRACYGMGYSAGFGNGAVLQTPADRVKSVHLFGGNFDLYSTDRTFIQVTMARAWNVTDGFAGLMVLPNNPLTGAPVGAPVVMRYSPSANLGAINLYGVNLQKKLRDFDVFGSLNWSSTRPNGITTPFGGLMSDPFQTPVNKDGQMYYVGIRYSVPKDDGRTKLGFEFNHGIEYWFNFAQASDDIIAPKTVTRGNVYETYLTHRISDHFLLKGSYINYDYIWSGSGWQVGAPKRLNTTPILAFPTYDTAKMFTVGLVAEF